MYTLEYVTIKKKWAGWGSHREVTEDCTRRNILEDLNFHNIWCRVAGTSGHAV